MKFKKGLLIICLIICLFAVASVSATDANDMTMTATEDIDQLTDNAIGVNEDTVLTSSAANEVLKADEQTFSQLNTTINGNNDSDIYLNSDYKYANGDGNFTGGIVITRDVNIYGNGHTINGSNEARIFQVTSGNVVFYNITFVNGHADGKEYGGAIYGNCKAINCTFKGNQAYFGGAMDSGSAVNCTFTSNYASSEGGAMSDCSAVNCCFTNNYAAAGGAMSECSAVNCTFTSNKANKDGGAMAYGSAVNCTFTSNQVNRDGGAMFYGYKVNCIGQEDNDYYFTGELYLHWEVNNFITINAGETLPIQLKNQEDELIAFINYDVVIYNKNGDIVRTYHCLSNDELSLDLALGNYTAELKVTYPGLNQPEPKSINLTIPATFWDLNQTINNNINKTITLDKNYAYNPVTDSAFTDGIVIDRPVTINGNGYTINANGNARIFKVTGENVTLNNITFRNANTAGYGGAIFFGSSGNVTDCYFTNNTAGSGGAIYFNGGVGVVSGCVFVNNYAAKFAAIHSSFGDSIISGCVFVNNSAEYGVVGDAWESHVNLEIINNIFLNNDVGMYVIGFADTENVTTDYNWFGNVADNYNEDVPSSTSNIWLFLNATANPNTIPIFSSSDVTFKLFAYDKTSVLEYDNSLLKPINLTITQTNGNVSDSVVNLGNAIKYTPNALTGSITASIENVAYTIELNIIKANSTLEINDITFDYKGNGSTTLNFTNATGVIAEVIGQPNANVTVENDTITVSGLDAGTYILSVTTIVDENHNNVTKNATITVNKLKTELTVNAVTATYNKNKYLVITLKDGNGNALSGVKVTVKLKTAKTYTTDKNGQIKINVAKLVPKKYTAKIAFAGDDNYNSSSADVKVTVKKAKPKIVAKRITYKAATKNKKFKVTLKDNRGKVIKNAKVRLIVNKIPKNTKKNTKKYKKNIVKTNKKGKATFKVKRNKKGKYQGLLIYKGNKYYTKVTKKVKITIK